MLKLQTFSNNEFGDISIVVINGIEYFEATKIAKALGYSNTHAAIQRHCKNPGIILSEVGVITGKKSDGKEAIQTVKKKFIDEGNLYRLILKSLKPNAIKFEQWVIEEVLPSIRKYGTYQQNETSNLMQALRIQMNQVKNLIHQVEKDTPYINLGKTIGKCDDAINISSFAKITNTLGIKMGRNTLMEWFRENGYMMRTYKGNEPKQAYVEQGLFKTRQFVINTSEGEMLSITPYITGKGQAYFIKKLEESKYENIR